MHLNRISLINFGVFRGRHEIDLRTKPDKPVVLFGGKNGAGKSTILDAVYLCLYGSLAAGPKASREQYCTYLEQRIHNSPSLLVQPTFAAISIEFSYADLGHVHVYEVTRSWGRTSSGKTTDRLDVKRGGESLGDLGAEQWQEFVRELIPLGVSNLFFFDGEKIQHLAEDSTDQLELANSIKALLGVNLIERLQADLTIYQSRLAKANGNSTPGTELDSIEREMEDAQQVLLLLQRERTVLQNTFDAIKANISQIEQTINAEGGGFARRRESLIKRREEARARISSIEASIRQLCSGLLPFSLATDLLIKLRVQLLAEQRSQSNAAGKTLALMTRARFAELLSNEPAFARKTGEKLRQKAIATLDLALASLDAGSPTSKTIHGLSPATTQQLLNLIEQALGEIPRSAHLFGGDLEMCYRDLQKTEAELKRVPADEVLKPLLEQLTSANQQAGDVSRQLSTSEEKVREVEARIRDIQNHHQNEIDRLKKLADIHAQIRLVPKLNLALRDFTAGLIGDRVRQLERELADCFNILSRKTDSVKRVAISPSDFGVMLFDRSDAPLAKQALSAGEKQIYAIAVLWALAKVSRRPLPLIIDTPLGRLDSDHRKLLVDGYFPSASHQVILLSTDTEIDHVYFEALKPYIAKAYRLEFDMAERCTVVEPGYFEETAR